MNKNLNQKSDRKWTEQKLDCLEQYLEAYEKVMKNQNFKLLYIDAFAGSGYRTIKNEETSIGIGNFLKGSPRIALEKTNIFGKYIFIEKDKETFNKLKKLEDDFPEKNIDFQNTDANEYIKIICNDINWKNNRAVLFLDPFAMEVNWETLKIIAKTDGIDAWILFPAMAVNRLLPRSGNILSPHENKLNMLFGSNIWEQCYKEKEQLELFNNDKQLEKSADFEEIKSLYLQRLKEIFAGVAYNPLPLLNSKNSILFYLFFVVSNPDRKAQRIALRIAQYILSK